MTCIKTKETEGSTPAHRHGAHTHERNRRKLDAGFREGRRGKEKLILLWEIKRGGVQTREKGETM